MSGNEISQDHAEMVDELAAVVMRGDSGVDDLAMPGFPESLRCEIREAVRGRVVELERFEAAGAPGLEYDVRGGMMAIDRENIGGYRSVSVGGQKFVGSPGETRPLMEEHLRSVSDLEPADFQKLMELISDENSEKEVAYNGDVFECRGFGDNGIFVLTLKAEEWLGSLQVIVKTGSCGYADIKAIDHERFSYDVDKTWIKKFLQGFKFVD